MAETPWHNLDGWNDFIDKTQKELTPDQALLRLTRLLNSHNSRIDKLTQLKPEQKEKLKMEVKTFLMESLKNSLYEGVLVNGKKSNVIAEYNVSATDTNREIGLDSYEFTRYLANLEEAMKLIVELGWVNNFKSEMGLLHKEAYEATTLKMDLFGDRDQKSPGTKKFSEWYGREASKLTPEQIKDYTNTQLRWDKEKFVKGLSIAIGTELWPEAVEIAVNFVYDLGKAIMQLPEYMYFGFQFNRATTEVWKKEYSLKMKSRLDDNMALWLLALVYDGTADITQNLLGANISADAKWSRVKELIHSMWTPDTWTPAWIKEAIIWLLPFLKATKRSISTSWSLWEARKPNVPLNTTETKPKPPQQTTKLPNDVLVGAVSTTTLEPIQRSNNGDISMNNPKTAPLEAKMNTPEEAIVKERKVNGEVVKFKPDEYLKAYKEWLEKVGQILADVQDWVLMSSNAMYMNLKDYKMLPDDFDVVIRDKDFAKVYGKLFEEQKAWWIRGLELHSIDDSYKSNVSDPKIQQQLFEAGNLKIVFNIDTANGIPMEVELFPEWKGKWLTQLWTIPRTIESFILNGKEIKVSWIFDLADTYTINLMNELLKNSVDQYGVKAKDGARVYNLTHYLQKTGINKPSDLITKMDEVVDKYRTHAGADLAPGLEAIFARLPEVKEILKEIISDYETKQKYWNKARDWLPEFQEFTESWNKEKWELHKLYIEVLNKDTLTKEKIEEIKNQLKIYNGKTQSIMDKSLNDTDFAYFYEMSMMRAKYIRVIRDEMISKSTGKMNEWTSNDGWSIPLINQNSEDKKKE